MDLECLCCLTIEVVVRAKHGGVKGPLLSLNTPGTTLNVRANNNTEYGEGIWEVAPARYEPAQTSQISDQRVFKKGLSIEGLVLDLCH